ncbi:MAG TPA: hypothetical protein VHY35_02260 [Stellaceae bacterium]|jgi:hypothetical protein|nr:hypothetical protein [Stellaceae bacterium]
MPDPKTPVYEHGDAVYAAIKDLHEKIAAIDPNLVIALSFGPRDRAPQAIDSKIIAEKARTTLTSPGAGNLSHVEDFREHFPDGTHFSNVFSKTGDGFINVHGLEQ